MKIKYSEIFQYEIFLAQNIIYTTAQDVTQYLYSRPMHLFMP